jgi:hypothetical protein
VRVMVGRLELLSADRQRKAEAAIASLGSRNTSESERAYRFLFEQGRYVEPIVRRVARMTKDEQTRALCGRLLGTDFVTDLRAAIHNASDGKQINADRLVLRAQLARLLRQIGQVSDAKSEAKAVLAAIVSSPLPEGQTMETSPYAIEIRALAHEAMGEDSRAAELYARRVEQVARGLAPNFEEGQISSFRDWGIGRAYARCAVRIDGIGAVEKSLRAQIEQLSRAGTNGGADRAPRMLLAFLLDGRGDEREALVAWRSMVTRPAPAAASLPKAAPADSAKTGA